MLYHDKTSLSTFNLTYFNLILSRPINATDYKPLGSISIASGSGRPRYLGQRSIDLRTALRAPTSRRRAASGGRGRKIEFDKYNHGQLSLDP
jgi:hypothetical protein